ncbi:MAG: formate dehydrogenase accessory sulfurtransferase FdhD [Euryarchaeota archaeon]|nr:formate dehydrogenase accessory sulfurtransferase FdhD [Euryarchaeota archaeon]
MPETTRVAVTRHGPKQDHLEKDEDLVAAEEPLEIRVQVRWLETPLAVTMRTPGDDKALAAGFLLTEGIVHKRDDIVQIGHIEDPERPDAKGNVIQVTLRDDLELDPKEFTRNVYTTSSCGVCGKATLDAVEVATDPLPPAKRTLDDATLRTLPDRLRTEQKLFAATGGIHATGLFTPEGRLVRLAEDVGRHNAMDKALGAALLARELPLNDSIAVVSGRASFELVQKAARGGIPFLAAVGAPSSLAVSLADRLGMTLVGFLREDGYNLYCHPERLA